MIVLKVFNHKTLKIEFIGSIFDLNSTQVWAILCKCVFLKKNSLLNPNLVASKESYKSEKIETIGNFRCFRMNEYDSIMGISLKRDTFLCITAHALFFE